MIVPRTSSAENEGGPEQNLWWTSAEVQNRDLVGNSGEFHYKKHTRVFETPSSFPKSLCVRLGRLPALLQLLGQLDDHGFVLFGISDVGVLFWI